MPTIDSRRALQLLIAGEAVLIVLAIAQGNDADRITNYATVLTSLTTLFVLVLFHGEVLASQAELHREALAAQSTLHNEALDAQRTLHKELLTEQAQLRRLQSRPQVLVYFERQAPVNDRRRLVLVIKHFGGGPALDVQFAFSPRLVNRDRRDVQEEPPLSTGVAVMPPGYHKEIDFDDFGEYQNRAGLTRLAVGMAGMSVDVLPLQFAAAISLRDPLGDDQVYRTSYQLDLRHLMTYSMSDPNDGDEKDGPDTEGS